MTQRDELLSDSVRSVMRALDAQMPAAVIEIPLPIAESDGSSKAESKFVMDSLRQWVDGLALERRKRGLTKALAYRAIIVVDERQ